GRALDVVHDAVPDAFAFPGVMDRHDVGMVQFGEEARFPCESSACGRGSTVRMQDLNRYRTVQPVIRGEVDGTHSTCTQLAANSVPRPSTEALERAAISP